MNPASSVPGVRPPTEGIEIRPATPSGPLPQNTDTRALSSTSNQVAESQLPPHSREAEEAVLGACLIDPQRFTEISAFLQAEDFFILRHVYIWEALQTIYERQDAIDDLVVIETLRVMGRLEEIGGAQFLARLMNNTPTSLNAETYGHIVERAAVRRRLLSAASEIAQAANDERSDVQEVMNQAENALFQVTERSLARRELVPINKAMDDYFIQIMNQIEDRGTPIGVPTGFSDLDQLLGGLQRSDLVIVAARPGMGKTSLMLSVALNAARSGNGLKVAIFSLEMSRDQLLQRFVSSETGLSAQKLRTGELDAREINLFIEASRTLSNLNIFIDDTPALTPMQLRTKIRRLQREYGIDLIIVDYLQLMNSGIGKNDNRVQEISYISRNLKEIAREFNVPLLSAAQLSRQVEQRADKRPQLSDLRESGSIEQDADIVMFIYREDMYDENSERQNQADLLISKHRNGPTGTITLHFNKASTKFGDLQRHSVSLAEY
jgi:replicative DNA helicase